MILIREFLLIPLHNPSTHPHPTIVNPSISCHALAHPPTTNTLFQVLTIVKSPKNVGPTTTPQNIMDLTKDRHATSKKKMEPSPR